MCADWNPIPTAIGLERSGNAASRTLTRSQSTCARITLTCCPKTYRTSRNTCAVCCAVCFSRVSSSAGVWLCASLRQCAFGSQTEQRTRHAPPARQTSGIAQTSRVQSSYFQSSGFSSCRYGKDALNSRSTTSLCSFVSGPQRSSSSTRFRSVGASVSMRP